MNTPIFIVLATLIVGALVVDGMLYGSDNLIFLTKKFIELIDWVAFWR